MKLIPFLAALCSAAIAGEINIVQLGPPDVVHMKLTCAEVSQHIDLPFAASTGRFVLPEKEALVTMPDHENSPLKIPATSAPHIAVLSPLAKGYHWTLIPGKPTAGKWTMRVINLGTENLMLIQQDHPIEIKPDSITALPARGKAGMSIKIESGEEFRYDGREPCAVVALLHRKEGKWQVLFVPDR